MSQAQTTVNKNFSNNVVNDELILVVKRTELFKEIQPWHGIIQTDDKYLKTIQNKKEFHPRSAMELDTQFKQIIPYLVFTNDNKLFLMQRQSKASEARLQNKFSLGIGGHIRQDDMQTDSILDWSTREFHEEVDFKGELNIKTVGIINDDSNDVGKVHIGFVFLLQGSTNNISVKSELKSGELLTFDECEKYFDQMESWSQMVFSFLKKESEIFKI